MDNGYNLITNDTYPYQKISAIYIYIYIYMEVTTEI